MSKKPNATHIHIPDEVGMFFIKLNNLLGELTARWTPHDKQIEFLGALLGERCSLVGLETGRQFGKGESIIAAAGLWGKLFPGSQSHYMAPELKQARKILWDSGRIETMLPGNWIDDFKEKNNTVYWANSKFCFLTLDGADKFDAKRGLVIKEGVLYLDECRDMKEDSYDTIEPSLLRYQCPVVLASTPPEDLYPYPEEPQRLHWFCDKIDQAAKTPGQKAIFAKTSDNPHIPESLIEKKKVEWYARGKGAAFEREYMGQRVEGKASREWPMLVNTSDYVKPHHELIAEIAKDKSKLKWFCMTDPAGSSCWAWSFIALNPFTKKIYFLDELYETDKAKMAPAQMWPRALAKMEELYSNQDSWRKHYDEAEAWFRNEMQANYGVSFHPSKKKSKSKEEGFRLFSDIFLAKKAVFSDRCLHTFWEFKNYEDEDSSDHEVDNGRYFLNVSYYSMPQREEQKEHTSLARQRYLKVTGELERQHTQKDWRALALNNILH